jgi:hypothetical protein
MKPISLRPALCAAAFLSILAPLAAASVPGDQERAALEFLTAVGSGSAQAVGFALHPDELKRLRRGISDRLRADAARGDPASRVRLFGEASSLADIERLTDLNFWSAIVPRLRYPGRVFEKVDGIESVKDGDRTHVIVRGRQPDDRGAMQVVALVTLLPYGKEWKAAVPSEIEAQVEDLLDGREASPGFVPRAVAAAAPAARIPNSPEMLAMLTAAEEALVDGRCDDYYGAAMSPNFRRVTSRQALEALVLSCTRSEAQRETLVTALRIVRGETPRFEAGGNRAVYDVAGRGLPFSRFVLERVDGRWFVAE